MERLSNKREKPENNRSRRKDLGAILFGVAMGGAIAISGGFFIREGLCAPDTRDDENKGDSSPFKYTKDAVKLATQYTADCMTEEIDHRGIASEERRKDKKVQSEDLYEIARMCRRQTLERLGINADSEP